MKIAVIGSGVAGIVSAYLLQRRHEVTLYEKNDYIGGHTHTIVIEQGQDAGTPVDTGFIVFNEKTYPTFLTFLAQLGVDKQNSSMCFSYYDESTGLAYGSETLDTVFAQRRNLMRPSFWMMLLGILHFNRHTPRRLHQGALKEQTLGQYLSSCRYNSHFIERYLLPMCASVWSAPDVRMLDFPMETFARFFLNHGLFSIIRHPQWYTVKGGSHAYVKAFLKTFRGRVLLNTPVLAVGREGAKVMIQSRDRGQEEYDKVVLACHADEALQMLTDASAQEQQLLSPWAYSSNRTILHTDTSVLPPLEKVRSSWNYLRSADISSGSPLMLTYHMNRLQNLVAANQYCVTLNPKRALDQRQVIREMVYTHPIYTPEALSSQARIRQINGLLNTYYCGSYLGYGFHEDAVKSAVEVAGLLEIKL
ncbi:MAG: FAD-dependent oxidoreductase [Syntrophaceae bacterium]